jgi:hypothetical protein
VVQCTYKRCSSAQSFGVRVIPASDIPEPKVT